MQKAIGFDGYNGSLTGDKSSTLGVNCGMSTGRQGVIVLASIEGNGSRPSHRGPGINSEEDKMYTLNTTEVHGVAYMNLNKDDIQSKAIYSKDGIVNSLYSGECRYGGGECYVLDDAVVRKLLPKECAALQGFPKDW